MPNSRGLVVGLVLVALTLVPSSSADTPSPPTAQPAAVAHVEPAPTPADTVPATHPVSPIMLKLRAALDREREQIDALRLQLQPRVSHQEALALQRQIERVKLDTEVAILRIQADAAREAGHVTLAERLEVAATDLLTPPAATTPATRPAPRTAGR